MATAEKHIPIYTELAQKADSQEMRMEAEKTLKGLIEYKTVRFEKFKQALAANDGKFKKAA